MPSRLFDSSPAAPGRLAFLKRIPVFAAVFGGLGVLLILTAGVWALHNRGLSRAGVRVPGTVVGLVENVAQDSHRRRTSVTYGPRVRFRSLEGQEAEIIGLGTNPAVYKEGDSVMVLYPPGRPPQGIVDSSHELREGPLTVGAFGLLITVVGLLLWRARI